MGSQQQFCLRWNNHQSNMLNLFDQLLQNEALVDVTLACDGLSIKAHKVVLSACSPYFQALFVENPCQHPIVFMKDVQYNDLRALVDFMYKGEVQVNQEQLNAVLETAESLKVRGLTEVTTTEASSSSSTHHHLHHSHHHQNGGEGSESYSGAKIAGSNGFGGEARGAAAGMEQHGAHHHHHHHFQSTSASGAREGGSLSDYYLHREHLNRPVSHSPPAPSSPPPPPGDLSTSAANTNSGNNNKRSLSPTAKRRKAKPRKRLPENALIPSDHSDSDALDLSTASPPDLCMDTADNNPYDSAPEQHHLAGATRSNLLLQQAQEQHLLTNIKVEPMDDSPPHTNDKDYSSHQRKSLSSPLGGATSSGGGGAPATLSSSSSSGNNNNNNGNSSGGSGGGGGSRVGVVPSKLQQPLTIACPTQPPTLPSTSQIQSSIIHQDIRRLCQYSRQSQQHKPTWTEEDMVQALEAVQSGRLTYALAARKFDIPKATLHYYVILMKAVEAVRSGRMTAEIAAIKYNVRTSILLDCLFGRSTSGGSSTTAAPSTTTTNTSSTSATPGDKSTCAPAPTSSSSSSSSQFK